MIPLRWLAGLGLLLNLSGAEPAVVCPQLQSINGGVQTADMVGLKSSAKRVPHEVVNQDKSANTAATQSPKSVANAAGYTGWARSEGLTILTTPEGTNLPKGRKLFSNSPNLWRHRDRCAVALHHETAH